MKVNSMPVKMIAPLALLAFAFVAVAADLPIDIGKAANMGFADPVAGDGKGGWSDQGPESDFKDFDFSRSSYEGIKFSIPDPARRAGRAIITFNGPHANTGLANAFFDLSAQKPQARFLYLLHTSCWNQEAAGAPIGSIDVSFSDGSSAKFDVKSGIDIADWWAPGNCKNAMVAVKRQNKSSEVGVFLSKFELPSKGMSIASVSLQSNGKAVWIVIGATLSSSDISISDRKTVFNASHEWKPVDMSDIQVKPGTALDFSSIVGDSPAGCHGRTIINDDGELAFSGSPGTSTRLYGFNGLFAALLQGGLEGKSPEETDRNIENYAQLVRRQGYNFIRPLASDVFLMEGSNSDTVFNPAKQRVFDKLLFELKRNGVYSYITVAAYRVGLSNRDRAWVERNKIKAKMYLGDPETRSNWKAIAKQLLEHVNPYTKMALKDDPSVVCVEIYNEQEIGIYLPHIEKLDAATRSAMEAKWRAWLKSKYGGGKRLSDAAGKPIDFDAQKIPSSADPLANDFKLFLNSLASECFAWSQGILREIGYNGLVSQYNLSKSFADSAIR
ncbi:MAG: hypothetical protein WC506_07095, partial [Candidatus Micrarchaeia archaeon]